MISQQPSTVSSTRLWLILAVVLAADIMDLLDATLTNIAAPIITQNLAGGQTLLQWLGTSYALSMGVLLVFGGRLGDKFGQRRLFLIGIAGFTAASLSCGLSTTPTMLIVSRLVQGGFGALLIPQGMAIMTSNFPKDMMGKAFSVFGPVMGIAAVLGPILAGYLIHANIGGTGWRSVFLINILIGSIGLLLALKILPKDHGDPSVVLDFPGSGLLTTAMLFLLYGLIDGSSHAWTRSSAMMVALGILIFVLFAWRQATVTHPLLKPSLLQNQGFTSGLILGLIYFAVVNGLCYVISLYLQVGLGSSPFQASLELTPLAVGIILASMAGAPLVGKFGKYLIAIGLVTTAAGAGILFATLSLSDSCNPWRLAPAILVMGMGMGLCFGSIFDFAIGDVSPDEAGSASGSLSAVQQLAASMGSAVITSIFFATEKSGGLMQAMQISLATVIMASLLCLGLIRLLPDRSGNAHGPDDCISAEAPT